MSANRASPNTRSSITFFFYITIRKRDLSSSIILLSS
nr:MAG TPA: putative sporulation protein [Caudoviricetes sp.]